LHHDPHNCALFIHVLSARQFEVMQLQQSAPAVPAMSFLPFFHTAGRVASNDAQCARDEFPSRSSHDHDTDLDGTQYRRWLKWSGIL